MTPSTAIATRPPIRATALFTPDATPACVRPAAVITVVVSGATVMPMPIASTTIGAKYATQYESPERTLKSASPSAATAGPTVSGIRCPMRSTRPPAQRDIRNRMIVNGRSDAPVCVAV